MDSHHGHISTLCICIYTPVDSTLVRSSKPDLASTSSSTASLRAGLLFSVDIVVDGQLPCWASFWSADSFRWSLAGDSFRGLSPETLFMVSRRRLFSWSLAGDSFLYSLMDSFGWSAASSYLASTRHRRPASMLVFIFVDVLDGQRILLGFPLVGGQRLSSFVKHLLHMVPSLARRSSRGTQKYNNTLALAWPCCACPRATKTYGMPYGRILPRDALAFASRRSFFPHDARFCLSLLPCEAHLSLSSNPIAR